MCVDKGKANNREDVDLQFREIVRVSLKCFGNCTTHCPKRSEVVNIILNCFPDSVIGVFDACFSYRQAQIVQHVRALDEKMSTI